MSLHSTERRKISKFLIQILRCIRCTDYFLYRSSCHQTPYHKFAFPQGTRFRQRLREMFNDISSDRMASGLTRGLAPWLRCVRTSLGAREAQVALPTPGRGPHLCPTSPPLSVLARRLVSAASCAGCASLNSILSGKRKRITSFCETTRPFVERWCAAKVG